MGMEVLDHIEGKDGNDGLVNFDQFKLI